MTKWVNKSYRILSLQKSLNSYMKLLLLCVNYCIQLINTCFYLLFYGKIVNFPTQKYAYIYQKIITLPSNAIILTLSKDNLQ